MSSSFESCGCFSSSSDGCKCLPTRGCSGPLSLYGNSVTFSTTTVVPPNGGLTLLGQINVAAATSPPMTLRFSGSIQVAVGPDPGVAEGLSDRFIMELKDWNGNFITLWTQSLTLSQTATNMTVFRFDYYLPNANAGAWLVYGSWNYVKPSGGKVSVFVNPLTLSLQPLSPSS